MSRPLALRRNCTTFYSLPSDSSDSSKSESENKASDSEEEGGEEGNVECSEL